MRWLRYFWSPRDLGKAALASIGGLCVAVAGNAIYGAIYGLGLGNLLIAALTLGVAFVLFKILLPMFTRPPRFKAGRITKTVPPRPALITVVSLPRSDAENAARSAIKHHLGEDSRGAGENTLRLCWLLYTHNTNPKQSSEKEASDIKRDLERDYPKVDCRLVRLDDGAEGKPKAVYDKVREAYQDALNQGILHDEVIADVTGGTKAMSIGMDLACRELNLSMECIVSEYENGKLIPNTEHFVAIDTTGIGVPIDSAPAFVVSLASDKPPAATASAPGKGDGADGTIQS